MAPKRKSTTALGASPFYHNSGSASSSKKRLVLDEEQDSASLSRISTTNNTEPPRPYEHVQQPQPYQHQPHFNQQAQHLTSPSLENIVNNFNQLRAPSRYSSASGSSTGTNPTPPPLTPDFSYRDNTSIFGYAQAPLSSATTTTDPGRDVVPVAAKARGSVTESHQSVANQFPPATKSKSYLILGASRGIGLELARQLLQQQHQVIAVVRDPSTASQLWQATGSLISRPGSCIIEQCDVSRPADIDAFVQRMTTHIERGGSIDTVVLNAGILEYEAGIGSLQVGFEMLERHLRVNCVGNIVLARKLLMLNDLDAVKRRRGETKHGEAGEDVVIGRHTMFMSSDSASMGDFREYEDGFAAYGASKAALNMMIRHMAAELRRSGQKRAEEVEAQKHYDAYIGSGRQNTSNVLRPWESECCVFAMHPGEVSTDMANVELGWEVEGTISAEESVRCMLRVLERRSRADSGTFWRWDGKTHPW